MKKRAHLKKRFDIVIRFTGDLDMVPGPYHGMQDWINMAIRDFERQVHYNTKAEVVSSETTWVPVVYEITK